MNLGEIVLSIVFSGLLIVITISLYFVVKSRLRQIKILKRAVADIKLEQSELDKSLPEYIEYKDVSIDEKTSGRYRLVKLHDEIFSKRINKDNPHIEQPVPQNNRNILSTMQIKRTSKRFSRLEKII